MAAQLGMCLILLASPSRETLSGWRQGLVDFADLVCAENLDSVRDSLAQINPQILLLDYDLLGSDVIKVVAELINLNLKTKIVIFSHQLSDEVEWELFVNGVKGCCLKDIDQQQVKYVVNALLHGELWMRRSLACRLLDELGKIALEKNQINIATNNLLANLTKRELEIATLVGNGESNKQIACRLDITERTVKAHLTEVFRKLDVRDRLKLALIVTGGMDATEHGGLRHHS